MMKMSNPVLLTMWQPNSCDIDHGVLGGLIDGDWLEQNELPHWSTGCQLEPSLAKSMRPTYGPS